jgi:P27 family predicted phage terminase small subunit
MARPSKNASVQSSKMGHREKAVRKATEDLLKNNSEEIKPSNRLNSNQKRIFNYIVDQLKASEILGNIDIYLLETCSIAVDRLQEIEKMINRDFQMILSKELMAAKEKYTKDFFRCCNELSLSPQSRAKFGILAVKQGEIESDPLLAVLKGGKDGKAN